ncbi:MAG: UbiA family prenyltransferase [Candidatus Hodarchaeales archaeon]|jgi:4-hydroxybenzoate polyprenyltransferase
MVQYFAYLRILHPYSSLAVAMIAVILSLPFNDSYQLNDALIFGIIILLIQFTIGVTNDYLDRHLDELTKPWKPIPSGTVGISAIKILIFLLILTTLGLSLNFMKSVQVILILGLGIGLVYNLGMKKTIFSWLPLSLALPLLFICARLVNGTFLIVHLWSFPISLLLGPAINLANQLADNPNDFLTEKSLLYYCGSPEVGRRVSAILLILSSLAFPFIAYVSFLNSRIAMITGVLGIILSITFIISAERNKNVLLFPIAYLVTITIAIGFLISI